MTDFLRRQKAVTVEEAMKAVTKGANEARDEHRKLNTAINGLVIAVQQGCEREVIRRLPGATVTFRETRLAEDDAEGLGLRMQPLVAVAQLVDGRVIKGFGPGWIEATQSLLEAVEMVVDQ